MRLSPSCFWSLLALSGLLAACSEPSNPPPPAPVVVAPVAESAPTAPEQPLTPSPEKEAEQIAKGLDAPSPDERIAAARAIADRMAQGKPVGAALQVLINHFETESDMLVLGELADALSRTCHPAALAALEHSLDNDIDRISERAVSVLGFVGSNKVTDKLDLLRKRLQGDDSPHATSLRNRIEVDRQQIFQRGGRSGCDMPAA